MKPWFREYFCWRCGSKEHNMPSCTDGKWITMLVIISVLAFVVSAHAAPSRGLYPNKTLTPGVALSATKEQVCKDGYTATVRDVTESTKKQVFQEYGIPYAQSSQYEVDHFLSLELSGSNDIKNLWPEPYNNIVGGENLGARQKDQVEDELHREVCAGVIALQQAQEIIRTDWVKCFHTHKSGAPCK